MLPAQTNAKKRVLVVDEHPMMRLGIAQLLNQEPDLVVSCDADSASQALNLAASRELDLVLSSLSLPDKSGLELLKDLQVYHPDLPVLVVSAHDESLYAERALRAGGRGYLMKRESARMLLKAVRQVLSGQIFVSEKMSSTILEIFSGQGRAVARSLTECLTDREFEIFQLIGRGLSAREMASQLHLSVKTVEVHRANLRRKLSLKSGFDLLRYAIRWTEAENG